MQTCLQLQWLLANVWAARHTYISKYDTHATECCSAEALQYMRQALRCRIYADGGGVQTCLQLQWLLADVWAARHTYISKYDTHATECCSAEALQYMRQAQRSRIYEGA